MATANIPAISSGKQTKSAKDAMRSPPRGKGVMSCITPFCAIFSKNLKLGEYEDE